MIKKASYARRSLTPNPCAYNNGLIELARQPHPQSPQNLAQISAQRSFATITAVARDERLIFVTGHALAGAPKLPSNRD
jgi:hypothetical protein